MHGGKNVFISVTCLRSWPSRHQHEVWSLQQLLVALCVSSFFQAWKQLTNSWNFE